MPYSALFAEALLYANEAHADQLRKGTPVPYITHLLAVAALVAENGGTEEQVIAALLHDAPEDQGGQARLDDIRRRFGEGVARIVAGCSDTFEQLKPPWLARKESYLRGLETEPSEVLLVSAADKLHNGRCLVADLRLHGDAVFAHFNGGKDGTLWYYRALVQAYEKRGQSPLVDEVRRVVSEMHRLAGSTDFPKR